MATKPTPESAAGFIQSAIAAQYADVPVIDFQSIRIEDGKAKFELKIRDEIFWVTVEEGF